MKKTCAKIQIISMIILLGFIAGIMCSCQNNNEIDGHTYPNKIAENAIINDNYKTDAQDLSNVAKDYFANKITKIPRPSLGEDKMREFVIDWAKSNGLNPVIDKSNCVYVDLPATEGMQNLPKIILQAHMDMVIYSKDPTINLEKDAVELEYDEQTQSYHSKNFKTNIGADDGQGLAALFAIAENKNIAHGPLRLLFTYDEEVSMTGASNLSKEVLDCPYLINLDGNYVGAIYNSSAGFFSNFFNSTYEPQTINSANILDVRFYNLCGGHSGKVITDNRGSAIELCKTLMNKLSENNINFNISSFNGGNAQNVICSDANIKLVIDSSNIDRAKQIVKNTFEEHKAKYNADADTQYNCEVLENCSVSIMNKDVTETIVGLLNTFNFGASKVTDKDPNNPLISSSIPVVKIENGNSYFSVVLRSNENEAIENFKNVAQSAASKAGYEYTNKLAAPVWEADNNSQLCNLAQKGYSNADNFKGSVFSTHIGLECAYFKQINTSLDIISIGADVSGEHGASETLYLKSMPAHFAALLYMLQNIN